MKSILLFALLVLFVMTVKCQSINKVFEQAKTDYYNFQYTSAIDGFEIVKDQSNNLPIKLKSYYFILMSQFELGNTSEALDHLFSGSDLAIEKYGDGSSEAGDFYIGYGKFYHQKESYDTAKMFYRAALELKDQRKEPSLVGEIYANLGYACDYYGEFDSALLFYQKSATILESTLGLNHPYTDWVYASMPYVAYNSGNYQAEVETATKSLAIKEKLWGSGTEDHFLALKALAVAYEHAGKAQLQKQYFEQVLDLALKLYGAKSKEYATTLSQLGNAYSALNDVDKAAELNIQSYELEKKLLGEKDPETLNILRNIGNVYYDGGKYQKALLYYEQNLSAQQKLFGKSSKEVIQLYLDVAQVYENTGAFDKAKTLLDQALKLQEKYAKEQIPKTLIALARIHDINSKYKESLETLDEALLANLKYNNGDLATEAFIKNNIGIIFKVLGDYEKAMEYLNESLEIRENSFGNQSAEVAQVISNIGNVFLEKADYRKAEENFRNALIIEKSHYGPAHPQIAITLANLASVHSQLGDIRGEISLLIEAERIHIGANGKSSPELVNLYNNLSIAYIDLVILDSAQLYADKHLKLSLALYGKQSEQMADNLNLQGIIKYNQGDFNLAFDLFKQSISMYEVIFPDRNLDLAAVYNNLGTAYLEFHEYTQAQDYLDASLRIYKNLLGDDHPEYYSTLMNLGLVAYGRSNYTKAIDLYNRSLKKSLNGQLDSLYAATVHQNLSLTYAATNDYQAAIHELNKARDLREPILGIGHVQIAHLLINMGNYYEALKEYQLAIESFESAEKIILANDNPVDFYSLTKLYLGLSEVYGAKQDVQQSMKYADRAIERIKGADGRIISQTLYFLALVKKIDLLYRSYSTSGEKKNLDQSASFLELANQVLIQADKEILNDQDRIEFGIWKSLFMNVGIKNALALHAITNDDKYLEEAFYYAERSKANILIEAIRENKVKSFAGIDQKLVERERELIAAIQAAEVEIFGVNAKEATEKYENLRDHLFELNREYERVVTELRSNPRYQKLTNDYLIADLEKIRQNLLKEDEAAIEIAVSDSTLHVFFITQKDLKVFSTVGDEHFDVLMDQVVDALLKTIEYKSSSAFKVFSDKLYDMIMKEVESYIEKNGLNIKILTFVPEGPFNYFPFETIRRNDKYLIEDYNIRYSYSLTLSEMIAQDSKFVDNNSFLAFAPVFADATTSKITSGARDVFVASSTMSNEDMRGFSVNGEYISALPGTNHEVDAIDKLVEGKGHRSNTYLNEAASEEMVKSGILGEYEFIHFATHGFVNKSAPAFSGVFLSQDEKISEDCILFASEIYGLDIQADLVTLSACETGLGKFAHGEGIVGLTRAFLYAGAKNLLVSQWKVSDESTAKMMVDFYEHVLSGSNKTISLREAKLALINDERFSQPYYWAPFVLIGQ